jgi:hypothetical protein
VDVFVVALQSGAVWWFFVWLLGLNFGMVTCEVLMIMYVHYRGC